MRRNPLAFFLAILLAAVTMPPGGSPAQEPPKPVVNSLGMTFVPIPAGAFLMGSPEDEPGRDPSENRHQVQISRPFYMQTTEMTLGQWRALMGKKILFGRKGDDRMPVTRVSWFDTQAFIEKLNARGEGTYRLPTEAEWEYASRAGTTTAFSWGDTIDCDQAMYANSPMKFDQCVALHRAKGLPVNNPAPVKSYGPNPWGLYDMHGNVWEWCQDWYGPYPQGSRIDPRGPGKGVNRVRRGGSWFGLGPICRSANRAYGHPAQRLRTTGFRLVREVDN